MNSTARSLLVTIPLYFAALGAVAVGLYGSLTALAPAVQAHFLNGNERPQSRLDYLVANAREVRQALATPVEAVAPLPPITARPLRAIEAKPVKSEQKAEKVSSRRPGAEARSAYAMSVHAGGGATTMGPDRYRPQ
jgi:hypothetical protein